MHATATVDTTAVMPPRPQAQVMTPEELRELMGDHGHTNQSLAELLGVHRNTVSRWLHYTKNDKGETLTGTPIDAANTLLIRTKLKAKKRKK
jgi:transposase